jgi:hypothetical protein
MVDVVEVTEVLSWALFPLVRFSTVGVMVMVSTLSTGTPEVAVVLLSWQETTAQQATTPSVMNIKNLLLILMLI